MAFESDLVTQVDSGIHMALSDSDLMMNTSHCMHSCQKFSFTDTENNKKCFTEVIHCTNKMKKAHRPGNNHAVHDKMTDNVTGRVLTHSLLEKAYGKTFKAL